MSTSLSSFADNLSETYSKKCKDFKSDCEFKGLKNNNISCNCKDCRKKQLKPINRLIEKFPNTYKFCNNNINKFIFLLKKEVCPYEYMDIWERFNKLQNKKAFYSNLYLEDIIDEDYIHAQKAFEELELKTRR